MKPDQLQTTVCRINNRLLQILKKLHPAIIHNHWAKHPDIKGIIFLIESALSVLDKASTAELNQILSGLQAAKNILSIQQKEPVIATAFVFFRMREKEKQIETENLFWAKYQNNSVLTKRTRTRFFTYFMAAANISGFTENTFFKLFARKYGITEQTKPQAGEPFIFGSEAARNKKIAEIEPYKKNKTVVHAREIIYSDFEKFIIQAETEKQSLTGKYTELENLLIYEIENRNQADQQRYLHLKFNEKVNQNVINLIFAKLNGKAFHTSENNFKSVFRPEKTTPIEWKFGLNAFLKLFLGFENLNFDGIARSFPGLINHRKDVFHAIAEKFTFDLKTAKPIPHYISGKTKFLENTKPNEMADLWPIIEQLNKMV